MNAGILICHFSQIQPRVFQFFQLLKANKRQKPLHITCGTVFEILCPIGDSNPCFGLERAASWAARRMGPLDGGDSSKRPIDCQMSCLLKAGRYVILIRVAILAFLSSRVSDPTGSRLGSRCCLTRLSLGQVYGFEEVGQAHYNMGAGQVVFGNRVALVGAPERGLGRW
jgi:hypothetical protein